MPYISSCLFPVIVDLFVVETSGAVDGLLEYIEEPWMSIWTSVRWSFFCGLQPWCDVWSKPLPVHVQQQPLLQTWLSKTVSFLMASRAIRAITRFVALALRLALSLICSTETILRVVNDNNIIDNNDIWNTTNYWQTSRRPNSSPMWTR